MENKLKIKSEIKRLKEKGYPIDTFEGSAGYYDALDEVLNFIDSLPEVPVSEDLEVELTSYMENSFTSVEEPDEFLTTVMQKDDLLAFARHFANWKKEQMMKDAIKCEITWMDGFMLDYTQEQQDDLLEKIGAKVGDKVKLVIIKED